jgi:hypothetical protein
MSDDKSYKSKNRPSDYRSNVELNEKIETYLDNCRIFKELPNMPGLSLYLGFNSLAELFTWVDKNKRFQPCLSRARTILEDRGIQILTKPDLKNGNGLKAYMSKAFGYSDKLDINSIETTKVIRLPAKKKLGDPIKKPSKKKKRYNFQKKKKGN